MLLTGILTRTRTLIDMCRIIVVILFGVFIPIYTFAGYDGRSADDPYRTSPTWLYLLLAVGLFALIGKWARAGIYKKNHRSPIVS